MKKIVFKIISSFILLVFGTNTVLPVPVYGQALNLPPVGQMVMTTPQYAPAIVKGIKIFPDNPLRFNFIVDTGDTGLEGNQLKEESEKLIKYFLASLTIPEEDIWVNLSPYEKDRIIPNSFGMTEMGRDLLAQDYILKQLTASLMYPEDELGETFWDQIFEKAYEKFGTTEIPINTFNKVWIMPEKAVVYENEDTAFVVESRLKVMLEEDYLALEKSSLLPTPGVKERSGRTPGVGMRDEQSNSNTSRFASDILRSIIIPAIEKEVNEGKHFAQLRQIYHALILATWFKMNLQKSLLGQIYVDQNKVAGVDVKDKHIKDKIYNQYLDAFKEGVYDYIREDFEPATQQIIPRKYFSGGWFTGQMKKIITSKLDFEYESSGSPVVQVGSIVKREGFFGSSPMKKSFSSERNQKALNGLLSIGLKEGDRVLSIGAVDDSSIGYPKSVPWELLLADMGVDVNIFQPQNSEATVWKEVLQSDKWKGVKGNVNFLQKKFSEESDIKQGSMDAIVMMSVLSHGEITRKQRVKLLQNSLNAVKDGGHLIVGWYNFRERLERSEREKTEKILNEVKKQGYRLELKVKGEAMHQWRIYQVSSSNAGSPITNTLDVEQVNNVLEKTSTYSIFSGDQIDINEARQALKKIHSSLHGFYLSGNAEHMFEKMIKDTLFALNKDKEIVGYIMVDSNGHAQNFAVHSKIQGQGIGKRLILEGMMKASREGHSKFTVDYVGQNNFLFAIKDSKEMKDFYANIGTIVPVKRDPYMSGVYSNSAAKMTMIFDISEFTILVGSSSVNQNVKNKLSVKEVKKQLISIFTKGVSFAGEKRFDNLLLLKGQRIGETNSNGQISFEVKKDFQYQWKVLGFKESGWNVVIDDVSVLGEVLNLDIRLVKEGRNSIIKRFQIGGLMQRLLGRRTEKGNLIEIFKMSDVLGRDIISEIISNPKDLLKNINQFPNLRGLELGVTGFEGEIKFSPFRNYIYRWNALGFYGGGWRATISDNKVIENVLELGVIFTKDEQNPVYRKFQIGSFSKKLYGKRNNSKRGVSVLVISEKLGLIPISSLIQYPKNFNWLSNTNNLPNLKGLRLGVTDSNGQIKFNPISKYIYMWSALGFKEEGWEGFVVESYVTDKAFEFRVRFQKKGKNDVEKIFQIGSLLRTLKGLEGEIGKTKEVLRILDKEAIQGFIERNAIEAGWESEKIVPVYKDDSVDDIFNSQILERLEGVVSNELKGIIDMLIDGEVDYEIIANGFSQEQINFVRKKLQLILKPILHEYYPSFFEKTQKEESISASPLAKGGIDFNPNNLNIETQGKGIDYNAPIDPQLLESLTSSPIEGFTPVIFNITPILNLPALLGLQDQDEKPLQQSKLPIEEPYLLKYWQEEIEITA